MNQWKKITGGDYTLKFNSRNKVYLWPHDVAQTRLRRMYGSLESTSRRRVVPREHDDVIRMLEKEEYVNVDLCHFSAVAVTSSTVPSSSSTSTAVLGGGAVGIPPPPPPSVVKNGGPDRFYPGGSIHHHHDHHQPATAAPTLPHVPPPAIYPVHPHQPPIHNGPPSSSPPKTSIGQKKKNSTYNTAPHRLLPPALFAAKRVSRCSSRPLSRPMILSFFLILLSFSTFLCSFATFFFFIFFSYAKSLSSSHLVEINHGRGGSFY